MGPVSILIDVINRICLFRIRKKKLPNSQFLLILKEYSHLTFFCQYFSLSLELFF